jgi:NAD(P)-dependent dehydrogenase (short-subunit alcohol dehydrogenase family)
MTEAGLAGRTIVMSGGSRGIGLAIALRAAQDGADVVLIVKTDVPDPRLPGTIHSAVAEIEAAGGSVLLPVGGDIRDRTQSGSRTIERALSLASGPELGSDRRHHCWRGSGPHGGHTATERDHRQPRQPTNHGGPRNQRIQPE